jgi:hypothetical protein
MIVIGLDPGSVPGYAVADRSTMRVLSTSRWMVPQAIEVGCIVTEDVWFGGKGTPATISKLAFTCGRQLEQLHESHPSADMHRVPVAAWKDAAIFGGGRLRKDLFIARLRIQLRLGADVSDDCVEAAGIALYAPLTPRTRVLPL